MNQDTHFGCGECWVESADETWRARAKLEREKDLIDESHFHVMVMKCRHCAQPFLSVFFETIDWTDGDDPQSWVLIPITESENATLALAGAELEEKAIYRIGVGRRSLLRDAPKGMSPTCFWRTGIPMRMHD